MKPFESISIAFHMNSWGITIYSTKSVLFFVTRWPTRDNFSGWLKGNWYIFCILCCRLSFIIGIQIVFLKLFLLTAYSFLITIRLQFSLLFVILLRNISLQGSLTSYHILGSTWLKLFYNHLLSINCCVKW